MKNEEYRKLVTEQFLQLLDEKKLSWTQGWSDNRPVNGKTGQPYHGTNLFYLSMVMHAKGFKDNRWYSKKTMHDVSNGKALIKSGNHGSPVEWWCQMDRTKGQHDKHRFITFEEADKLIARGERTESDFRPTAMYYYVFNAEQIDGIPERKAEEAKEPAALADLVTNLSTNMGVPIVFGGDRAFYKPDTDEIHLPEADRFKDAYELNATALHELAHSTGSAKRLDRQLKNSFGSEAYAFEELIAEMASCFMAVETVPDESDAEGHLENHEAYLQSWLREINNKPEYLFKAAKLAGKAADYMDQHAQVAA